MILYHILEFLISVFTQTINNELLQQELKQRDYFASLFYLFLLFFVQKDYLFGSTTNLVESKTEMSFRQNEERMTRNIKRK